MVIRMVPDKPRVALLAEGVDRNLPSIGRPGTLARSPSSRRAWIEIALGSPRSGAGGVALLAEGVDRNFTGLPLYEVLKSRPPRGGRG